MDQQKTLPKWLTYTLLGVAIILIASAVLRVLTPKKEVAQTPLTTTNYDQTTSNFSNLTYTGPRIDVPLSLNTAQVKIADYKEKLKTNLIARFNLKQIQDYDVWTSENWALTIEDGDRFIISNNQKTIPVLSGTISLIQATSVAQKFLDEYLSQYQVTPLSNQAEYFEGQYGDPAKTTASKAQAIKVVFGYAIDEYPVFYENSANNFIEIYVDSNETITKASFSTIDISLENTDTKPGLSPQMALEIANQTNQAAIINTGYESPAILDFSNITSGEFDVVEIEYRVDPTQNLAYPFYRFSGFVTDGENQSFSAELITPAIEVFSTQ